MIVLPIQMPSTSDANDTDDDTPQEWSLLELNGELLPPTATTTLPPPQSITTDDTTDPNSSNNTLELGSISFDDSGTPLMTIGAHELKGKIEPLAQPFIVMQPLRRRNRSEETETEEGSKRRKVGEGKMVGYEVAGVISKKVLFATYPKSIIH